MTQAQRKSPWIGRQSKMALVSFTAIWFLSLGTATAQTLTADSETSLANATQSATSTGLSSDQIHTVVAEHRLEVRSCVMGEGLELPTRLDLVIDFLIGADGRVVRVTVYESNAGNGDVEACVLEAVGNFEFPEPGNGREFPVRYPFMFITGN